MNYFKSHLFHLVSRSPWPFFMSMGAFFFTSGMVFAMHRVEFGCFMLLIGFCLISYMASQWFYNIEDEATLFGYHTLVVKKGLYKGFVLFLVSEFMLFFGFFWAFFHSALSPSVVYSLLWPFDQAFMSMNCLGLPGYNTILLMASGLTVTYAHVSIASSSHANTLDALYMTMTLGILFLVSQINEYFEIAYNLNDSIFSSVFFMLTGLHGFHVFVGVFCLYVCLNRVCNQEYSNTHYLGLVCSIWYWHFVDAVWIFLYVAVYVWGNWTIETFDLFIMI